MYWRGTVVRAEYWYYFQSAFMVLGFAPLFLIVDQV